MSLINDAIKRAASARPAPSSSSTTQLNLKPVQTKQGMPRYSIFMVIGSICALGTGTFLFVKGWQATAPGLVQGTPGNPLRVTARESSTPIPEPGVPAEAGSREPGASISSAHPAPTGPPTVTGPRPASDSVGLPPTTVTDTAVPANQPPVPSPLPSTFPQLKLQGIFYRPANPSVLINSKTLHRGETIQKARVVQISKNSVTLVWEGQTKVLTID